MRGNRRGGNSLQIPHLIKPYSRTNTNEIKKQPFYVKASSIHSNTGKEQQKDEVHSSRSVNNNSQIKNTPLSSNSTWDYELDSFLIEALSSSPGDAIESFFQKRYDLSTTVYYQDIPSIQLLYSTTYNISSPQTSSLVGFAFHSKAVVTTSKPTSHPSYHPATDIIPFDVPVAVFPLLDVKDKVTGVVEIIKPPGYPEFTDEDTNFFKFFMYKYQIFSRFFDKNFSQDPLIYDILSLRNTENVMLEVSQKLQSYFGCRCVEAWRLDTVDSIMIQYGHRTKQIPAKDGGIVSAALDRCAMLNCPRTGLHPNMSKDIDSVDEPLLVCPISDAEGRFVFGLALRGCQDRNVFTKDDESALAQITPFVALALSNAEVFSAVEGEYERSRAEREGLAALLEVAEVLSGQLEIDKLTEVIMEKGRQLTHADRCSLFIVSQARDRLITSFQRGLKNSIDLPINKGIAGMTVSESHIVNIADAYSEPAFDSSTDVESGYKTRSILSVPIYNNRGEVMGVTEMVNKMDMTPFTKWDEHLIQIFNVFCGISLENARLYKESIDMANQLRSFFDVSVSFSKTDSIQKILRDIINNARGVIGAARSSVFLVDETTNVLSAFISDGSVPSTLPLNAGIAGAAVRQKECILANDAYGDARFNRSVDQSTGFKTDSILAAPIVGKTGSVLGVVEMLNKKGGFLEKDIQLLQSFATFASVSLEKNRLETIAELGSVEVELPKFVGESEKAEYTIPVKLQLSEDQIKTVTSLNYYSIDWAGSGHIKILFYVFNHFKIMERFKITNEMLFRFIYEIRETYNDVPYHNWIHAVDVTEYVSYQIITAKLEQVFTPLEIFALILAAICHDANHDGFNNVYNLKAETPLGILFKNQSVMETHHCSMAIQILTKDECNLLHSLNPADQKRMWNWIIKLILATDMAHHFKMVKETAAKLDEGKFDLKNDDDRLDAMELILKVADISNVSRPFKLADQWCDVLSEEFWRQGDNERANGQELSSPLNDRENKDKPKGQIGFYNFICIPLYQVVARIFPPLSVNLESVKSNLEVWKSLTLPPPPPADNNK